MDFGDILRKWEAWEESGEKGRGEKGRKKEAGLQKEETPRGGAAARSLEKWLEDHPDFSPEAGELGEEDPRETARRRPQRSLPGKPEKWPVEATVDLHGLTRKEAEERLRRFLQESRSRGVRKILVIHGKGLHSSGEGVLKRLTVQVLEGDAGVGAWRRADKHNGGDGATWAVLRQPAR